MVNGGVEFRKSPKDRKVTDRPTNSPNSNAQDKSLMVPSHNPREIPLELLNLDR